MDERTLRAFTKVADLQSFTKAAAELGYVQSTVSNQIQQLECELGFPLFDRIGKKIYLTSLGQEFRSYADVILENIHQSVMLGKSAKEIHGVMRVGVLESLLFSTLADILPHYARQWPNIEIQIKMGRTKDLLKWLRLNQLDMVYLSDDLNSGPDFFCAHQHEETLAFVSGPNHELAGREQITVEEFFSHPLVVTERSGIVYRKLQSLAHSCGMLPKNSLVVDNTKAIAEILKNSEGLSFLPEYSVRRDIESHALVKLNVNVAPQIYFSQIIYHRGKWMAPFMEGLIDLIRWSKMAPGVSS